MLIELKAEVLRDERGVLTLEIPDLHPAFLTGLVIDEIRMTSENGDSRPLTRGEERDLEDTLDAFAALQLGRAMAKLIRRA
jgi:hypothetical protein